MKNRLFLLTAILFFSGTIAYAQQDSLGLPGDNFDLCGALELFKKAQSPEDFEKALNQKDNKVNNLDLNGDGNVDYVRVIDHSKGDAHALVLQVAVNEKESQDVAVIEIEKKGEKSAQLQIVGDEELYGKDYIIEPKQEDATKDGEGKWRGFAQYQVIIVDVWYWPCVQYIWYPGYVIYVSPWYWGYWPGWWYPWAPYPYYIYYGWMYPYHHYYYWTNDYRMHDAHSVYQPRRTVSPTVQRKYEAEHQRYETKSKEGTPRGGQQPVPGKAPQETTAPRSNVPPAPQQPAQNNNNTPPPAPTQPKQGGTSQPKGGVTTPPPAPNPKGGTTTPAPAPRPKQNPPKQQPTPQPKKPR